MLLSNMSKNGEPHSLFITKTRIFVLLFIIFTLTSFTWISHIKPPMSSPDETAHLARADALRNGNIFLFSPDGKLNSGGNIDKSMNYFSSQYEKALNTGKPESLNETKKEMQNLHWSGKKYFHSMANTAFYFPIIYVPQAVGIQIGHILNLNVYSTYKLTTSLTLLTVCLILLISWKLHPIPTPAIAVLLLPMSIYQIFSPTIDGLTFSLTILTMSLSKNLLSNEIKNHSTKKAVALFFVIFVLSSSRANLLPLLLLPLFIFLETRKKIYFFGFSITSLLVISWTVYSIKSVYDNGIHHPGIEQIDVLKYYTFHPLEVFSILLNTLKDCHLFFFYIRSFIGVLGWLNIPISDFYIYFFGLILCAVFFLNISAFQSYKKIKVAIFITLLSFSIIILTFCALLVQWSTFPALKVDGVQGRYFIIPFIIIGYAIMDRYKIRKFCHITLIIMAFVSVYIVHATLQAHYF